MIIAPIASLDVVIREALAEVRRGVATARTNNQANPTAGMMVDLPEFVEFEIQVITGHQSLSRATQDVDNAVVASVDVDSSSGSEEGTSSETNTETGSESATDASQNLGSRLQAQNKSTKDVSQDHSDNSRDYGILDEGSGEYTPTGQANLNGGWSTGGAVPNRTPSVNCG